MPGFESGQGLRPAFRSQVEDLALPANRHRAVRGPGSFRVRRSPRFAVHRTGGPDYEDYLGGIKGNPIAKKVKIADMLSNLSDHPSDRQIVKYAKGLLLLVGDPGATH